MEEFVLFFRQPPTPKDISERQQELTSNQWTNWFGEIAAEGRLYRGKRLEASGKVLRETGVTTDGPLGEMKEQLSGFIIVLAETLDEASTFAHDCPALKAGGTVEIRPVIPRDYMS
jgi:hypothetical protein